MRPRWVASTAAIVTVLAGCSSAGADHSRADASPSSSTAATLPVSEAPSPVAESSGPPPSSGPIHRLGERVRLVSGSRMTIVSWQRVQRPGGPARGAWWAADVRFCITKDIGDYQDPVENIRSEFLAELADGSPLTPESDARGSDELWAEPGEVFKAGQCRQGTVVFDVPTGQRAQYFAVTYSPFDWVRWQLT